VEKLILFIVPKSKDEITMSMIDDSESDYYSPTSDEEDNEDEDYTPNQEQVQSQEQPPQKRRRFNKQSASLTRSTSSPSEKRYNTIELLQPLLCKMFPQYEQLKYMCEPVRNVFEQIVSTYYHGKKMNYPTTSGFKRFSDIPVTTTVARTSKGGEQLQIYIQKALDAMKQNVIEIVEEYFNQVEPVFSQAIEQDEDDEENDNVDTNEEDEYVTETQSQEASDHTTNVPPTIDYEFYASEHTIIQRLSEAVQDDYSNNDHHMKITKGLVLDIEHETNILKQQKQDLENQIEMLERITKEARQAMTVQINRIVQQKKQDVQDRWNRLLTGDNEPIKLM
jgi:hypothetical protein